MPPARSRKTLTGVCGSSARTRAVGGAGAILGDLTPECAAAVTAVMEALGKKRGPEDDRNEAQRFHDALAEACALLGAACGCTSKVDAVPCTVRAVVWFDLLANAT